MSDSNETTDIYEQISICKANIQRMNAEFIQYENKYQTLEREVQKVNKTLLGQKSANDKYKSVLDKKEKESEKLRKEFNETEDQLEELIVVGTSLDEEMNSRNLEYEDKINILSNSLKEYNYKFLEYNGKKAEFYDRKEEEEDKLLKDW